MVVGVLVEISNQNVDRIFEYSVPSSLRDSIKIGIRVLVPFGRMTLEGFVLEIKDEKETDKELREVLSVVDQEVVLNQELLELGKRMKEITLSSLISCFQVMLPKSLKAKNGKKTSIKYDTYYQLSPEYSEFSFKGKQLEIVELLKKRKSVLRKELVEISSSSVDTLLKKGVLVSFVQEHYRKSYQHDSGCKTILTEEQQAVVSKVIEHPNQNFLLYGVTGSGKTEVYMEIIDYYLSLGKTSIVLVPEISLTPQMVERFEKRFGNRIAAIHSGLSDGEKFDEWRRIYRGEASIVIGARSAIFAPLSNIGVIIIDEEHSDSYKQSDPSPRYHARDIAFLRAKTHQASVVMGSATPSLESMARAQKGIYTYLELLHRVNGRSLPKVSIVDMNEESHGKNRMFSKSLLDSIDVRLKKKEQVILLLNRRGYSTFISCKNCGFTFKCPHCDITLTYHKSSNTLRCHYCGFGEKVYDSCPKCHEKSIHNFGIGTEKIEEELHQLFPSSRILRMDFDTTSRKGKHEEMISSFKNLEYDILLGTQMVAKGLDFPNVTLVGVINADTSLNIPDFRSSENTFSLLNQVAGRSGRSDKSGEVIIQTFNPLHYAIHLTKYHDYFSFYQKEMTIRQQLKYPPYYYLCNIRMSGKDPSYLREESVKIKNSLDRNLDSVIILGPSSASVFKLNNIYRYQILLKYKKESIIYSILIKIMDHYQSNSKIRIDIDFNPSQML